MSGRQVIRDRSGPGTVVVEAEVDIRRSPEDVFDFCSDVSHEPEWNPMMKRVVNLTDGSIGVGARYRTEFVDAPPMVMECTHYERPSAWAVTGESRALKAVGDGHVVPTAEGAHLVMRMELEPQGLLRLARPLLRRGMRSMFQTDVENIKFRLEAEAGVVGGETLIFAANGLRCPLTQVAERAGAERGSVTDIYLPHWFARNLPAIHVPLILLAGYLHGQNLRGRRRGRAG
jgi:uncharacterized protein YndB with AHSA1/START domain